MRVAFIFIEKYPNYDLDVQLLSYLNRQQSFSLDTYVKTGLWGFDRITSSYGQKQRQEFLTGLMFSRDGNLARFASSESLDKLLAEPTYIVQFDSIPRRLALKIHDEMQKCSNYLCFTQVLSHNVYHKAVFSALPHRYKIEKNDINVLFFSDDPDSESVADDILEWFKEKYVWVSFSVRKKDMGSRFLIFDQVANDTGEYYIPTLVGAFSDQWEVNVETLLYNLQDIAPEAVSELKSASDKLMQEHLSAADCAQIAVNLRRCLEKTADVLMPATSNRKEQDYKGRLKEFIVQKLGNAKYYNEYVEAELLELFTRIEKLYNMGNKGVHENWMPQVFSVVVLRLVLLLRELLLPLKNVKPTVYYDPGVFNIE